MYEAAVDAALSELRQDLARVADLGAEGRPFEELIGEIHSAVNRTGVDVLRAVTEMRAGVDDRAGRRAPPLSRDSFEGLADTARD